MKSQRTTIRLACLTASFSLLLAMTTSTGAAEWGALKGRFVLDGDTGEATKINVNKDPEFCGKHNLVNEEIIVGEDGALANVFVYLYLKRKKTVEIHPDLETADAEPVVVDNKGCRFEPHAIVLRTGQTLEIRNSDPVAHNTNLTVLKNLAFNQIVPNDSPLTKTFEKRESYPSSFACNIHTWMKGYVLIRDNPYMAVTAADGNFEIANLPAGEHEFIFWHEAKGNMKNLAFEGGKTSKKGRAKLTIPAGETLDLGEIKVKPAILGK